MFPKLLSRRGGSVVVAALLTVTMAACGTAGGGSRDPSGGPIKIGTSLPLTGEFSQPGQAAEQGYKVWQAMVNQKGGLLGRQVELVIKDDASNQNTIVADYNALISRDRVDLLIGSYSSLLNLPASAVAERNRKLYVQPAGGAPQIFNRGYRYLFYSQQGTADRQGTVFAEYIASLPADQRPKTAAYPTLDDPFAKPSIDGIRTVLEKAGVQTVYQQTYAIDTRNLDSIASAVKAAGPDLVVHGANFDDGVGLVRSLLKSGFVPKWGMYQTTAPSLGSQYADAIGAKNTEGIMYAVSHDPSAKTPGNAEFVAKYTEMFGGSPPEDAADAYAAGEVLAAAVTAVGSLDDQQKLADWLRANSVKTILGELSWNDNGSPKGEFLIGQWQQGQIKIVLPRSAATGEIARGWKPEGVG